MNKSTVIKNNLSESIQLKESLFADEGFINTTVKVIESILEVYRNNGKVLICGNGGSAADAQHLAAEFSGKYYLDRPPLHAEALHLNTSYLTAVANDYSFDEVYSRMIRAIGKSGDILIALSTSGNSQNVINALVEARNIGCTTIGFTGEGGGRMKDHCDIIIEIPSSNTPRIQECHMLIGHSICELVEKELFEK